MKLSAFLSLYAGSSHVTIKQNRTIFCEGKWFDYYLPVENETGSITDESWWNEIKDCSVENFTIIGGYDNYPVELVILLR